MDLEGQRIRGLGPPPEAPRDQGCGSAQGGEDPRLPAPGWFAALGDGNGDIVTAALGRDFLQSLDQGLPLDLQHLLAELQEVPIGGAGLAHPIGAEHQGGCGEGGLELDPR